MICIRPARHVCVRTLRGASDVGAMSEDTWIDKRLPQNARLDEHVRLQNVYRSVVHDLAATAVESRHPDGLDQPRSVWVDVFSPKATMVANIDKRSERFFAGSADSSSLSTFPRAGFNAVSSRRPASVSFTA